MKVSHILWDFNGTLFDDVKAGIQSANVLLGRRSLPLLESVDQYREVFCFPIATYYNNIGLNQEPFELLAQEWMEQYLRFSRHSSLYEGAVEVLTGIKAAKIPQIVLSATERQMLLGQLEELEILPYFDQVLGLDNIHAYSKAEIARRWVEENRPANAVLFGDSTHDFDVAKMMGVSCVLIAGGHQSRTKLETCGVPVIDSILQVSQLGFL